MDTDQLNFAGGALTVTLANADGNDWLAIQPGNGISLSGNVVKYGATVIGTFSGGSGSQPLVISFNGSAMAAGVQVVAQSIGFSTLGDRPTINSRSAVLSLTDGDGGSFVSEPIGIAVTAVNDPPKINMSSTFHYYEDTPPAVLSPLPTVTDLDSDDFDGAVLTVANLNGDVDDRLAIGNSVTASGTISLEGNVVRLNGTSIGTFSGGLGTAPLTVTFNSASTVESALAVVRNVTFQSRAHEPTTETRSVVFQLTDGDGGTSNAITKSVNVVLVNDKPTLTLGGNIVFPENSDPRLLASGAVLADPDSPDFDGGVLTVTISANASNDDRLLIGAGTIAVSGSELSYAGRVIGTFTDGAGATPWL